MKIRISAAAAIALFVVAPLTVSRAQTTSTTCTDGTTSTAVGKGACSGHGGIKAPAKTTPAASKADVKTAAPSKTKGEAKTVAPKPKATKSDSGKAKPASKSTTAKSTTAKSKTTKADSGKAKPPAATKSDASNKDATGATALCKDGTYSHAATHTGACSGHGGVDKFLK